QFKRHVDYSFRSPFTINSPVFPDYSLTHLKGLRHAPSCRTLCAAPMPCPRYIIEFGQTLAEPRALISELPLEPVLDAVPEALAAARQSGAPRPFHSAAVDQQPHPGGVNLVVDHLGQPRDMLRRAQAHRHV